MSVKRLRIMVLWKHQQNCAQPLKSISPFFLREDSADRLKILKQLLSAPLFGYERCYFIHQLLNFVRGRVTHFEVGKNRFGIIWLAVLNQFLSLSQAFCQAALTLADFYSCADHLQKPCRFFVVGSILKRLQNTPVS